ncbi:hypothetical protein JOC75_004013 [Metabacillus crassostreae]|uniref:hypothetical protein n=1 Tax=Metabacillus crassostreae TaxID=929098 RepID=UPI001958B6C6|nr:hypothetical protein [Metabacillus crassostreae]MBM7605985.1 hypothetical protein [Metabacillus crassostreae]
MIYKIYNALLEDPVIIEKVGTKIKFYEYPASGDVTSTHIIIDPLDVPIPSDYADNKWLTEDFLFQIEVWSLNLADTLEIAKQIRKIMWNLNFSQGSGIDEYDKDFGIYRDARRYRGKVYEDA